jgi:hypothetical protein
MKLDGEDFGGVWIDPSRVGITGAMHSSGNQEEPKKPVNQWRASFQITCGEAAITGLSFWDRE